jgi:methylated-DNA-[protein]-cysteine S-methyltransferase
MQMKNIYYYQTEVGKIGIAEENNVITNLYFGNIDAGKSESTQETPLLKEAGRQLVDYLAGKRKCIDLPLAPEGTAFQKTIWAALQQIPYGETRSYGEIAKSIGNPKAARAVGMANNKNPIALFIPCHRVIGANGKMVGYAGGLDTKEHLLKMEKVNANS